MSDDTDHDRISRKAHEIWESEGRPHGRDQAHWDQAKEIVALHDSMGDTLLPRDAGAFEPEEPTQAVEVNGDMPGITDQGRDDLVDIDREPDVTKPSHAAHSLGDTAGHVARSVREDTPGIDDDAVVTPAPTVAAVTPTPSDPMLGEPAPRAPETGPGTGVGPVAGGPASSGGGPSPVATGTPPVATPAGAAPAAPDDAEPGSAMQASPTGNSAPVAAKVPPKPAAKPAYATKGKPGGRR